jgi:hypothetical protein
VMFLARHVLQYAHSLLYRGLRSGLPEDQSSALIKAERSSCWKTNFSPLKTVMLGFHNSWHILFIHSGTSIHTFHAKMKRCHPLMEHHYQTVT